MVYSIPINDTKKLYWANKDVPLIFTVIDGKCLIGHYILKLELENMLIPKFILTGPTKIIKEFRVSNSIIAEVIAYIIEREEPKWRD